MRRNILALVLAAGCGGLTQMAIDAGDGDGGSADASPTPLTPLTVTCVDHKQTVTAPDGSRSEYTYRRASFPEVSAGDDFEVRQCDYTTLSPGPACPVGYTCTGSTEPAGQSCYVARHVGNFYGGKLSVLCGYSINSYAAGGAMTGTSGFNYGSITVSH